MLITATYWSTEYRSLSTRGTHRSTKAKLHETFRESVLIGATRAWFSHVRVQHKVVIWKRLYSSTDQVCVTCSLWCVYTIETKNHLTFLTCASFIFSRATRIFSAFPVWQLVPPNRHITTRSTTWKYIRNIVTLIIAWLNTFQWLNIWTFNDFQALTFTWLFQQDAIVYFDLEEQYKLWVQKHKKQDKGLKTSSTMTSVDKHNLLSSSSFDLLALLAKYRLASTDIQKSCFSIVTFLIIGPVE